MQFSFDELVAQSTEIDMNQPSVRRLVDQTRSRLGIMAFVGAGISVPYGLPGWKKFLLDVAAQNGESKTVEELLADSKFEEAAGHLIDTIGALEFDDAFADAFGEDAIVPPGSMQAASLLPYFPGPVITTNFDHVLEKEFHRAGKSFDRAVTGTTPSTVVSAIQLDSHYLFKIHGDVHDPSTRILTPKEYDAHYGDLLAGETAKTEHARLLQRLLESRSMLFLGCSLQSDRTVTILEHAGRRSGALIHYALVPLPSTEAEWHQRKKILSKLNIRPIWYPAGRHDLIPDFLSRLITEVGAPPIAAPLEPLVTPESFFKPLLTPGKARLFHQAWDMVGRNDFLERLHSWVDAPNQPIAVLTGRGGIGKTKLLHAFAEAFPSRQPGISLRFVLPNVPITPSTLTLAPGLNVVVIDDAHHREDLGLIAQFARTNPDRVKLLLTSRPFRIDGVKTAMGRAGFDTREITHVGELTSLATLEAENLARQALGPGLEAHAGRLAAATGDSPLITVIGGQLLRERFVSPETLERDEEFRTVLLDRFQDELEGNVSATVDKELVRNTLALVAATGPVRSDSSQWMQAAADFLHSSSLEVMDAIDALETAGVLARRGRLLRIVPDVLADHALYRACFRRDGSPTGYAQRVYMAFQSIALTQVLSNLAELDWKIARSTGANTALLDEIWSSIQTALAGASMLERTAILALLEEIAVHQPNRTLRVVEFVIRNPAPPLKEEEIHLPWDAFANERHDLPPILMQIAYNEVYLPRVCGLLWELGRDDDRSLDQHPDHPIRILIDLASYDPDKPLSVNEAVSIWLEQLIASGHAHSHLNDPFDIVDPLLAKAGSSTHADGPRIASQPFVLSPASGSTIRSRALDLLSNGLVGADTKRTLRILESLFRALEAPSPPFNMVVTEEQRAMWTSDRLKFLSVIESVLTKNPDPTIHLAVAKGLEWYAERVSSEEDIASDARRVIDSIPKTDQFIALAVVAGEFGPWPMPPRKKEDVDFEARESKNVRVVRAYVENLVNRIPDVKAIAGELEDGLAELTGAGIDPSPWRLWEVIDQLDPTMFEELAEYVIENPDSQIARYFETFLSMVWKQNNARGTELVGLALDHDHPGLYRAIASWGRIAATNLTATDRFVVDRMLNHRDDFTRRAAARTLAQIGRFQPAVAADLALGIDITSREDLAEEVCKAIVTVHQQDDKVLGDDDFLHVISSLRHLQSIDSYYVGKFLQIAASRDPRNVASMLRDRIADTASRRDSEYDPLPIQGRLEIFKGARDHSDYVQMLREIRAEAIDDSWRGQFWYPQLYAEASARFSPEAIDVIREWALSTDSRQVRAAARLLREAPPSFVFEHFSLVEKLLDNAFRLGGDCLEEVQEHLKESLRSAPRQRTLGIDAVFPEDENAAQSASEVLKELAPGSPTYRFFKELEAEAEANMQWQRLLDEEQFG